MLPGIAPGGRKSSGRQRGGGLLPCVACGLHRLGLAPQDIRRIDALVDALLSVVDAIAREVALAAQGADLVGLLAEALNVGDQGRLSIGLAADRRRSVGRPAAASRSDPTTGCAGEPARSGLLARSRMCR